MKKTVSLILALLILASCLLSGCSDKNFDYVTADLSRYVDLELSDFTGLTFELESEYPEINRELADREFRYLRLYSSTYANTNTDVYTYKPEWGDQAYIYYDLTATEGGASLGSNLYSADGRQTVSIGYYEFYEKRTNHPLFDNETLSAALMNVKPVSRKTSGSVTEGDVLRVSYTAKLEDGTVYKTEARTRIDTLGIMDEGSIYTARYGMDFVSSLFEHRIGEEYSFDTTITATDSAGSSTEKKLTYTVKIDYVAEESFTTVAIPLPAGAFDETYSERFRALNGTTVYLNFFIDSFTDYDVPAFDINFLVAYFGITTTETNVDKIFDLAYEKMYKQIREERREQIKEEMMALLARDVLTEDRIKKIPSNVYKEHISVITERVNAEYSAEQEKCFTEDRECPYKTVDEFAMAYLEYTAEEFGSLEAYAKQTARETVSDRLFIFRMAELAGLRLTHEEIKEEYDKYLVHLKETFPTYTEYEIIQTMGGEEELYWYVNITIVYGSVCDYIYDNNSYT